MSNKPYVFLITIDCLRADYSSVLLELLRPFFEEKGYYTFKLAFANGPGTNQSFPSIFSSTPFLLHGDLRLHSSIKTLAQILRENGYYTVGFHSNPFLSSKLGWGRGFAEFYDFLDKTGGPAAIAVEARGIKRMTFKLMGKFLRGSDRRLWSRINKFYYKLKGARLPYIEARELNNYVVSWLKRYNQEKPLFLWIHYMDTHTPFAPPHPWLEGFNSREEAILFNYTIDPENPKDKDVEKLRNLYKGGVKYVATALSEFVSFLRDQGLLENALLIITADHGEAFMEHGKLGHVYDALYNEVLHVPLIISGLEADGVVEKPVPLMDLAPTVLEVLGIERPRMFMGLSLYPLFHGEERSLSPIFSESAKPDLINLRYDTSRFIVSVIYGRWKLIYDLIHSSEAKIELYDVQKDFSERVNLINDNPDIANYLFKLIENHLREIGAKKILYEKLTKIRSNLDAFNFKSI